MVTWAISIARIVRRRRLICQPPNTHPTTSPRRRPPDANAQEEDREVASVAETIHRAGRDQLIQAIPGHRSLALALPRPMRGSNGQSQRRAQARRCERSLDPFPTVQRAPARQSSLDRVGAWGQFQRSDPSARRLSATFGRHSMSEVAHPLRRIPKMMRHEFQRERLRRRPRQRLAGGGVRPDP